MNGRMNSRGRQDGQMVNTPLFVGTMSSSFDTVGTNIPFDDKSGVLDKVTSFFKANTKGVYKFMFEGESDETSTLVSFRMNYDELTLASSRYLAPRQESPRLIKMSVTANLREGDTVEVFLDDGKILSGKFWGEKVEMNTNAAIDSSNDDGMDNNVTAERRRSQSAARKNKARSG